MSVERARVLILLATCLAGLMGCSSAMKIGDFGKPNDGAASNGAVSNGDLTDRLRRRATGRVGPERRARWRRWRSQAFLAATPMTTCSSARNISAATILASLRRASAAPSEKHPRDAEAWVGLAASYDRLHRFDLADRAYQEAIRIVGPTPEILNNQGFSYMLRGDYARAKKKLEDAQAKDPGNPYIQANMRLLEDSYREGKSVQ